MAVCLVHELNIFLSTEFVFVGKTEGASYPPKPPKAGIPEKHVHSLFILLT